MDYRFNDPELTRAQKDSRIRQYFEERQWTDNTINLDVLKQELRQVLDEEPGVEVVQRKQDVVNEANGETIRLEFVEKLVITYTIGEVYVPESGSDRMVPSFEVSESVVYI